MDNLDNAAEDRGTYHDTGTSGQQPNIDVNPPEGGGIFSRSAAGGAKKDPMSGGPTAGHTIAGSTSKDASEGDSDVPIDDSAKRIGGAPQHLTVD